MDLTQLRQGNTKAVTAALPDLTDEQLVQLNALEAEDASPRKGVLDAILAEKNRRAEPLDGDGEGQGTATADDAEAPPWQAPDYVGPLTGDQAQWRLAHIKPTAAARTK